MIKIITHSERETVEFGKFLASKLQIGDIVVLSGDLGAGKTKLTEGILSYFNLQDEISSPTFTIVNEYNLKELNIYHFDVYRLEDSDEFYAIGGEEYFSKGICIIEWGEKIKSILPNDYIEINFSRDFKNDNFRTLDISFNGNLKLGDEDFENFKC